METESDLITDYYRATFDSLHLSRTQQGCDISLSKIMRARNPAASKLFPKVRVTIREDYIYDLNSRRHEIWHCYPLKKLILAIVCTT